ncbi:MAG: hypothetical protein OQK73_08665 [Gammaproteobacteria bacterium]|nr:hypothetical protein [Gammaproteobacteria bacterium]
MKAEGHLPNLYHLIARANSFDMYSYEFEMMQAETIAFSNAKGLVSDFVVDECLDIDAFETAWHEQQLLLNLQSIAQSNMDIDDLQRHPKIKQALLEAYLLGKNKSV